MFFLILVSVFALTASAEGNAEEQYREFLDAIPEEVADYLPSTLLEATPEDGAEALEKAGDVREILSAVGAITGLAFGKALSLLAKICGLLLLAAVFRSLAPEQKHGAGAAFSFCSTLTLSGLLLALQRDRFAAISTFFDTVRGLSVAFLPLMGTLYAMGGNVRAAVVNHSVLSAFLTILETFCAGSVLPVAGVCLALALLDALAGGTVPLRPLAGFIKRSFTLALSFLMLLLCGVLGLQSTLARASDTLALRSAKFAAGSFLPVVGGSIAQTLGTVAASVEYLRSVAGGGAILVLFFAFLPTFLSVLLTRTAFLLGSAAARLLHCEQEDKILSELGGVYGYFLAVMAAVFVMLVFSLTLFARCAAAPR